MDNDKNIINEIDAHQAIVGHKHSSARTVLQNIERDKREKRCRPHRALQRICLVSSLIALIVGVAVWILLGQITRYLWLPIVCFSLSLVTAIGAVVAAFVIKHILSEPLFDKRRAYKIAAFALLAVSAALVICVSCFAPTIAKYDGIENGFCYNVSKNNTVEIIAYRGKSKQVVIPARINGCRVTSITGFADSGITAVTIPDGIITVGESAFKGCKDLTEVTLPDSIISIGVSAFEGCSSLSDVTIPTRVVTVGAKAFKDCLSLTSLTVGEAVKSVGAEAFANCSQLTEIRFNAKSCDDFIYGSVDGEYSDGVFSRAGASSRGIDVLFGAAVEKVPAYMFVGSEASSSLHYDYSANVVDVKFESGSVCKVIGQSAFQDTGVIGVQLPTSLREICSGAFRYCASLDTITVPANVRLIGTSAFYECVSLKSVILPEGITSIDYSTFSGCSSLTSVTLPDSLGTIGDSAFYGCGSLTEVIIPDNVTSIGAYAFSGCSGLTSISIPAGVNKISDYTFQYCSGLISMTIDSNITSIGEGAFFFCSDLEKVTIPISVTEVGRDAFDACRYLTIYCAMSSKPDGWDDNWNSDNRPVVWGYDAAANND